MSPRKAYPGVAQAELSGEAVPSLVNQATFMREFLNRAKDADLTYYVMEAFDQPWKASEEGAAGSYWGIYNADRQPKFPMRSEEHTSELQSLMRISYAVFCLKKKK